MKPSLTCRFAVQPKTEWRRFFRPFILLLALPLTALGQLDYATPYTISTLAGGPLLSGTNDGTGSAARFTDPVGAAVDSAGNLYVGDSVNGIIRRVTPAGVVTTIAGMARISGTNDGTGSAARFNDPFGVAVDGATNLYVADRNNHTIRKLAPIGTNWMVTTLVGTAGVSGTNDGTGSAALFNRPFGVAVDGATNLYVTDTVNCTIRKITLTGTNWLVTTLAGRPLVGGTNDGIGSAALFRDPFGVAVDNATNLYVVDYLNDTIRKLTMVGTNWVVTTLAGTAGTGGRLDGTNTNTLFNQPEGITVDSATNLYVSDTGNNSIRKLTPMGTTWVVTTLAGTGFGMGENDGTGNHASFYYPAGVAVDGTGNLYVADLMNNSIRRGFLAGGAPVILTNGNSLTYSNGLIGFDLAAAAGQSVVVDASTDSVNWFSIWTNTVGPGVLPFSDSQGGTYSHRFYRAHLP